MHTDHERCYRAVQSRDRRFDGVFYTAVSSTGIYCRPSCPALTPKPEHVTFHATAASAQEAGYRACRRCRPDTTPGSPEWDVRADAVGRAMQLIGDGVVEREGVEGLSSRLGYSSRHVTRLLAQELGAGPLALARSNRAHTARVLIETTDLPMSDIAFAAGFASIRQFNASVRQAYALTPTQMRGRRRGTVTGRVTVRLAVRQPFHAGALLDFLAAHVLPGVEAVTGATYARVLRLPHGLGVMALTLDDTGVVCELELADLRDTAVAIGRARRLLDLDADPVAIDTVLGADPALADLVAAEPGLRVPSHVDGFELAVRTVVGQQVSVAGANTVLGRHVPARGTPVDFALAADHGLTHAFPEPEAFADADPTAMGMPHARARTIIGLAQAVADGKLDLHPGADRAAVREQLLAMRGIGPWTADYVVMRGLGDPDILLTTDLVLRRELERRGITADDTERWRPWRSYAGMHLWRASAAVERIPA
ncbi:DNA-3-methyladenine glycosylase 2 family protein [Aeromicrobium wangtongii]|uniref:DNA-3-methyladenine glycosylase II n=1 Tax=Aeromicrobium wangtongii TaxID=2969247 RepID=A0ABY5MAM2_9ACTN|nr:DNA-3-methyladenine glycosylase 2 family protein [Aeromicrobium wangtongii]MCD9197363.1 DNA-3-methyladenine glycosylase 2 family protein [Aeromicrobium wangtongii]UUP14857.1 DNA-3-methyladenine glycosylase 2 family protein [Aeromicrobium wangtongii]